MSDGKEKGCKQCLISELGSVLTADWVPPKHYRIDEVVWDQFEDKSGKCANIGV
jgi:hypothetical protein